MPTTTKTKAKNLMDAGFQQFGLSMINLVARSGGYSVRTERFGEHARHKLDWYTGVDSKATVFFLYGGTWQSGHRRHYRFVADTLTGLGLDVAVPDYRLYPEVRFHSILADVRKSLLHVLERLPDGQRLYIMGHSAGAQLGSLLTLNRSLVDDSRIAGFIGLAGLYDFYPFSRGFMWDMFLPEVRYKESQPVNYVDPEAPPLYLLHGEDDRTVRRGHSKSLMDKQVSVGGVASREVYQKMGHVDIILSFTRFHRRRSPVLRDISSFVENTS